MKPTYKADNIELYLGDCLDVVPFLQQVNLVFVDPPYNIGIFKKMKPADYLEWCKEWITVCDSALAHNGAFWVSHKHPNVLVDISREIERLGRNRINWITWDKYNGTKSQKGFLDGYTSIENLKSFQVMAEYLIYHANEGQWNRQCDNAKGFIFEPLRAYLADEWNKAKLTYEDARKAVSCAAGSGLPTHWFTRSQWALPTEKRYEQLRQYANHNSGNEYLRKEYEDLRKEYEDLRYTFNNPGLISSVWQIPPSPKNGHPTPKPLELLTRIIETTTNPGDTVLDPMFGSGTTALACLETGRKFVGCEIEKKWFDLAVKLIEERNLKLF